MKTRTFYLMFYGGIFILSRREFDGGWEATKEDVNEEKTIIRLTPSELCHATHFPILNGHSLLFNKWFISFSSLHLPNAIRCSHLTNFQKVIFLSRPMNLSLVLFYAELAVKNECRENRSTKRAEKLYQTCSGKFPI